MLLSKRRQNKFKKLQEMRRSYLEQLAFVRQFRKDEDGGLIVLTLLLLISMLVVGGMATDFMRYETERTKLQSVSDRAVLAAANLNQTIPAADVIENFFEVEGFGDAITTDLSDPAKIARGTSVSTISIDSQVELNTFYLRLIGMDTLTAPATSSAIQGSGDVEVSLVLDISGSMGSMMRGDVYETDANGDFVYYSDDHPEFAGQIKISQTNARGTRMFFLQQAAKKFVEDLLLPEYEDRVSINLIAYSAHVALSDELYMALKTTPDSINEDNKLGSSFGEFNITDNYAEPFDYVYVGSGGRHVIRIDDFGNTLDDDDESGRWVYAELDSDGNYVNYTGPEPTLRGPDDFTVDNSWADGKDIFVNPARCVTFDADEYGTVSFDADRVYQQVAYAHISSSTRSSSFNRSRVQCPPQDFQGIVVMSQDVDELQDTIDAYVPTLTTSIHRGMKWGVSLLDPGMRDIIAGMPSVDPAFAGSRPAEYNNGTTNKYVVIMTDGQTYSSRDIRPQYYETYVNRVGFSENTVGRWASRDGIASTTYNSMTRSIGSETVLNRDYLTKICEEAAKHVTDVYTISMGVNNPTMTTCASKPGNAFTSTITNDPTQPGMGEIFSRISSQITALRLSQ
ncbi:Tad domain-containing protein [Yoonia sp. GPGPB17]|uniref:TadE/TadG family type IV pilus assembly protein n=1 Tax=Yoonia sp. GPGPB17 TaxID=3026147 RepID=UPI0030BAB5E3